MSDRRTRRAELIVAIGLPIVVVLVYFMTFVVRWARGL